MLTPQQTQSELESLAGFIPENDKSTREQFVELGNSVVGNGTQAWGNINILQVFPPADMAERMKVNDLGPSALKVLEWLRNTLVLSPLLVTWYGISRALDAYTFAVKTDPSKATQSFIYLWQTGFGDQHGGPLFSEIAYWDVLLLGLVLLLTAIVFAAEPIVSWRRAAAAQIIQSRLEQALTSAALHLTRQREDRPFEALDTLVKQSEQLMSGLQRERQEFENSASQRERELGSLAGFTTSLQKGADAMAKAGNVVAAAQQTFVKSLDGLGAAVNTLATHQQKMVTQAETTNAALQALGANQGATLQALKEFAGKQAGATDNLIVTGQAVAKSVPDLLQAMQALATAQAKSLQSVQDRLEKSENQVLSIAQKLTDAQGELNRSVVTIQDALKVNIASVQEAMRANIATIQTTINELAQSQRELVSEFKQVNVNAVALSAEQQAAAKNFRTVVEQLQTFVKQQSELTASASHSIPIIATSASDLTLAVKQANEILAKQQAFLESNALESKKQGQLAEYVIRASFAVEDTLQAIQKSAASIHAIAVELDEIRVSLKGVK